MIVVTPTSEAEVDRWRLLAPDHIGPRTSYATIPPAATLPAVGGRQALNRARRVEIDAGLGAFEAPLPTVAGALVIKARVASSARTQASAEKHERDFARLLVLVRDPDELRARLSRKEVGYLRDWIDLLSIEHRAWRSIPDANDGIDALAGILDV